MLSAFKQKPFDLEPIFAAWHKPPMFHGDSKKDLPVETWLEAIRAGCVERQVPEEYWYKVGKKYLGPKAAGRFNELKTVITTMNGGKYRWTWKRFKTAMTNMGWTSDSAAETETIQVESRPSGLVWKVGRRMFTASSSVPDKTVNEGVVRPRLRGSPKSTPLPASSSSLKRSSQPATRPTPVKSKTLDPSLWINRSTFTSEKKAAEQRDETPSLARSPTVSDPSFWASLKMTKKDKQHEEVPEVVVNKPPNSKRASSASVKEVISPALSEELVAAPQANVTIAQAPKWMVDACSALDFLGNEHPKIISFVSAILITAGSIPAIPAVAAGAGGAFLASGTAHAIGAVAVGLGNWISATQAGNVKSSEGHEAHHKATVKEHSSG